MDDKWFVGKDFQRGKRAFSLNIFMVSNSLNSNMPSLRVLILVGDLCYT